MPFLRFSDFNQGKTALPERYNGRLSAYLADIFIYNKFSGISKYIKVRYGQSKASGRDELEEIGYNIQIRNLLHT